MGQELRQRCMLDARAPIRSTACTPSIFSTRLSRRASTSTAHCRCTRHVGTPPTIDRICSSTTSAISSCNNSLLSFHGSATFICVSASMQIARTVSSRSQVVERPRTVRQLSRRDQCHNCARRTRRTAAPVRSGTASDANIGPHPPAAARARVSHPRESPGLALVRTFVSAVVCHRSMPKAPRG